MTTDDFNLGNTLFKVLLFALRNMLYLTPTSYVF